MEARTELQPVLRSSRDVLYLDLALENVVRAAAERGAGGAGAGAAAFVAPLLQNLALSLGDNEEVCYCLKAWQDLPESVRSGKRPNKDDALRVCMLGGGLGGTCWAAPGGGERGRHGGCWQPTGVLHFHMHFTSGSHFPLEVACHRAAAARSNPPTPHHTPHRPWR